jgi:hypothetical protein
MYALSFTKVSFMNVGALAFGAKVFRIERILKLIFSFDEYEVFFLFFFLITFGRKLILFDIKIATPAYFLVPFAWKIIFQPFNWR